MHKKIKHIIAVSLIISAASGVLPTNSFIPGLGGVKAYASSHHYYDDDYDLDEDAYLEGIYLSEGNIDFDKDETEYDVNVGKDVEEIKVKAKPEYDDFTVEINGDSVDEDGKYQKNVKLDQGKNVIEIYVESDDDDKTYKLNVYRGGKDGDSTTNTSNTGSTTNAAGTTKTSDKAQTFTISDGVKKNNSWQRVDGKWKYVDGTGQYLKNTWWFDKDTGKNFHLDKDGYRTTGWFYDNNNWYYLNENGEMQTGWIGLNKSWYFLNKSGVMKMGWLEDSDGNWYFLDSNGAMKTGWLENSDGDWYYFDSTGKMIKDSTVNGYQLGKEGKLSSVNS